ncbi:HNH endonuclease [Rhodococcus qingshengii]|uniref:HNH endonuclease n=1 Tax=Rhodococcus qingshengii TaxID=334542 RepID=UPI001BEAB1EF|nr:HNH endonuclease [Rhodococcus qingshengii]
MSSSAPHLKTAAWKAIRHWYLDNAPLGGWDCAWCGQSINPRAIPRSAGSLSVDHIVPTARGGAALDRSNTQPMHLACNSSKCARGDERSTAKSPKGSRIW